MCIRHAKALSGIIHHIDECSFVAADLFGKHDRNIVRRLNNESLQGEIDLQRAANRQAKLTRGSFTALSEAVTTSSSESRPSRMASKAK